MLLGRSPELSASVASVASAASGRGLPARPPPGRGPQAAPWGRPRRRAAGNLPAAAFNALAQAPGVAQAELESAP